MDSWTGRARRRGSFARDRISISIPSYGHFKARVPPVRIVQCRGKRDFLRLVARRRPNVADWLDIDLLEALHGRPIQHIAVGVEAAAMTRTVPRLLVVVELHVAS